MAEELKRIDPDARLIVGKSGTEYLVHDTINFQAYQVMEEKEVEILTGHTAADLLKMRTAAIEAMQKNDIYTTSVLLYNSQNANESIVNKVPPPWMYILTLFARPKGYSRDEWKEADAKDWIEDWKEYSVHDLFSLASALKIRYDSGFLPSSPDSLQEK